MRLRYIGSAPTTLMAVGAELFPGDEFDVLDDDAEAFTRRADFEAAPAPVSKARRQSKTAVPADLSGAVEALEPTVTPEEVSDAVPDDH